MSDWSQGYVTEIGYTYGYYAELNPLRVQLALLSAGIAPPPRISTACELGFGQGVSINLHAAASSTQWWGTDFNPAQVGFARGLAQASGAGAQLFENAFDEFAARTDLPEFDYIGLHGIWTWVTDQNRATIVDFIRRKLKPGGVAYISYNTYPGWAAFMPMRNLLAQHANTMGAPGSGLLRRVESALDFGDRLIATNPLFARSPGVADRLKKLRGMQRAYVAHEYFNREWHPMHFADVAKLLQPAKREFGCSAQTTDLVEAINHPPEQRALLAEIADPVFRESVRDLMVNQQFRRDFWVKGARRLTEAEQAAALRRIRVVLITDRGGVPLKYPGVLGEASMAEAVYNPILDALASNKPMTVGELEAAVAGKQVNFAQLRQALLMLAGAGNLHVAQDEESVAKASRSAAAINAHLMQRAGVSGDISALASPVIGGGMQVNRISQMFLQQVAQGGSLQPDDLARTAWAVLSVQGQRVLKDGKPLEGAEANLAELRVQASTFVQKHLPVYKALQVI